MRRCAMTVCAAALAAAVGFTGISAEASGRDTVPAAQAGSTSEEEREEVPGEEEVSALLDFIKEKWDAGEFDSREDIEAAIAEGEEQFGVELDDGKREQLAQALEKLDALGLDHDAAAEIAKNLWEPDLNTPEPLKQAVKEQVVEPAKEAAKAAVKNRAKRFWNDLKDSVGSFIHNIFS